MSQRLMFLVLAAMLALSFTSMHTSMHLSAAPVGQANPAPRASGTYLLNLSSGAILQLDQSSGGDARVVWSPDSSLVAIAGADGLSIDNLADGSAISILPADQGQAISLSWSPDGTRLAFTALMNDSQSRGQALFGVNADGSDLRELAAGSVLSFVWTPDGRGITVAELLFAPDGTLGEQILALDPDTGELRTTIYSSADDTCQVYLAWSPDGRYLAYGGIGFHQGCGDNSTLGLYTWDATTGATQRLFTGAADAPIWQGGALLDEVISLSDALNPPISLVSFQPDGSGSTVLASGIPNSFPPPQPPFQAADGVILYTVTGCSGSAAFIVTAGAAPRRLSDSSVNAFRPNLAPDGSAVAWVAVGTTSSDLVRAPVDGSAPQTLLSAAPGLSILGWSPDGESIAFGVQASQPADCLG